MKVYQFTNNEAEYLTFVDDDDDSPAADYARPGFRLTATAEFIDLGDIIPGEGDCYVLDR